MKNTIPTKNNPEKNKTNTLQKKKNKCQFCKKKLGMISFTCKCGFCFCQTHLNPHSHNCTFDYKNEKKCKIIKENPKMNSKFIKI